MSRLNGAVVASALLAYGCLGPSPSTPAQTGDSDVRAEVLQRFDSLTAAVRRLDVERMLTFYATDTSVVRALDGRLLVGRNMVEKDFRTGFTSVRSIDRLEILDRHLAVLGPTTAVLTARLEEQFTDTTRHSTAL